jgi:hypothetical protein
MCIVRQVIENKEEIGTFGNVCRGTVHCAQVACIASLGGRNELRLYILHNGDVHRRLYNNRTHSQVRHNQRARGAFVIYSINVFLKNSCAL